MFFMKQIKAVLKYTAREKIDKVKDKQLQEAKKRNYIKVGKEIKKAKIKGTRINASERLQNKNKESERKIENKRNNQKKFIDEL